MDASATEQLKLREKAYESFTQKLLARDLKPGQFITQRQLVEITQLPLGGIRELIPRLEAEGLIKTVPQRGMQIAHIDLKLIRDAFQFRTILEREAAAAFAVSGDAALIAKLREQHERVLAACETALENGGISAKLLAKAQTVDWGMHTVVIDAMGNAIISETYRVNLIKIRVIREETTRLDNSRVIPTMQEHLGIIAAFEVRDPIRASEAMVAHIDKTRRRALGIV
jgi:DNA-binding GntR family transcriptional regulator